MITTLARNWWVLVLRGILAFTFGLMAFLWAFFFGLIAFLSPDLTIRTLTLIFGFYALLDGVFALIAAWSNRSSRRRWALVLGGPVGMVAGVIAFVSTEVTALALPAVIAAWAILTGVLEITAAIRLRREIENEWWLALGGLASVILGMRLAIWPGSDLVTMSWIIGIYAFVFGIMMLMLGFRLRGLNKSIQQHTAGTAGG